MNAADQAIAELRALADAMVELIERLKSRAAVEFLEKSRAAMLRSAILLETAHRCVECGGLRVVEETLVAYRIGRKRGKTLKLGVPVISAAPCGTAIEVVPCRACMRPQAIEIKDVNS